MTITLFAQPYDITAAGFYFTSAQEYDQKVQALRNDYGERVEEFEIQLIDGEDLEAELAKAIGLNQVNFREFLTCCESWDEGQMVAEIIALGELGYDFDPEADPYDRDITIYHLDTMRELVEQCVEEGLFGDIPEHLKFYIDYDAMARDLGMDYVETTIAGESLVYRCA